MIEFILRVNISPMSGVLVMIKSLIVKVRNVGRATINRAESVWYWQHMTWARRSGTCHGCAP